MESGTEPPRTKSAILSHRSRILEEALEADGLKLVLGPKLANDEKKYQDGSYTSSYITINFKQHWTDYSVDSIKILRFDFGPNFAIENEHLDVLIAKQRLTIRHVEILNARKLSAHGLARFAKSCPNLVHVGFESVVKANNMSLNAFLINCPTVECLRFTGCKDFVGRLRVSSILNGLKMDPKLAKDLKKLELTNQNKKRIGIAADELLRARSGLEMVVGHRFGSVQIWNSKGKRLSLVNMEEKDS